MALTKDQERELLNSLLKQSQAGKLKWEKTWEKDVFQVVFPDSAVRIVKRPNQEELDDYIVSVYDSNGEVVSEFIDTEETLHTMMDLYGAARGQARDEEKVVNALLERLRG